MTLKVVIYLSVATILMAPTDSQGYGETNQNWRKRQWYLKNTSVSMNVNEAWKAGYTGKGILVAVVDDGVRIDHPDLKSKINLTASYDFLEDRNISIHHKPGSHGTKCAGIIAGADDDFCGTGVAFDAQIASIRIFSSAQLSTDVTQANALSFKRNIIDVYSNSWGPGDSGFQVKGPGPRLNEELEKGTRLGRDGKGSIFVFAAGNGGLPGDSCAFSGYVNSIYTIAISGVNWDGSVPVYAEQCAGIMAVTYGQDMFTNGDPPVVTASGGSGCTEQFSGTSGTTAMASGVIALTLQANPHLTWRDVQHLIVRSSKPLNPPWTRRHPRPSWIQNKARLWVSSHFGFGLMDASTIIEYAKRWHSVPEQLSCEVPLDVSNVSSSRLVIPRNGDLSFTLYSSQENCGIRYLEHVQVEVNLHYPRRGYLEMFSTSPSGTSSKLLYSRNMDVWRGRKNLTNWRVTSLHYWGEKPIGNWSITIRKAISHRNNIGKGRLFGLKLILFGTKEDPLQNNTVVNRELKKIETVNIVHRRKDFPIHGSYSAWSRWSRCSKTCGRTGIQYRYRTCTNPKPQNGGRKCIGEPTENRKCNRLTCLENAPQKVDKIHRAICMALCPRGWFNEGSSCYKLSSYRQNWQAAKTACERMGSTLAIVNSQAEQQALKPHIKWTSTWIGLHRYLFDKTRWLWVDRSSLTYAHWARYEPNNIHEECVEMRSSARWNDLRCSRKLRYICEKDANECASKPCKNGATCTNTIGGYDCTCTKGFQGKFCDQDVNECENSSCRNGTTCRNTYGSYICTSAPGFSGEPVCRNQYPTTWCQMWSNDNKCSEKVVADNCKKSCDKC